MSNTESPLTLPDLTAEDAETLERWIASDWPVCAITDTAEPHRMGAALTYARRYGLFTLVGIAGEDDLDAPDLIAPPARKASSAPSSIGEGNGHFDAGSNRRPVLAVSGKGRSRTAVPSVRSVLGADASAALRDRLLDELTGIASTDDAALWARAPCFLR